MADSDDGREGMGRRELLQLLAGAAAMAALPARADTSTPAAPSALDSLRGDAQLGYGGTYRVLYTWTTRAQIAELRAGKPLLSRTESPQFGPSLFDRVMIEQAARGERFARLLRRPEYLRARFAWTNPWATLLGWPSESYGDQLIRVELREDAWLAIHEAQGGTWRFVDMLGGAVKPDAVYAKPRRLAGVYFVQNLAWVGVTSGTFGGSGEAMYREIVLCNEAMIGSFEVGTVAPCEAIGRSTSAIQRLLEELRAAKNKPSTRSQQAWSATVARRWASATPLASAVDAFEAGLAFPNLRYRPEEQELKRLVTALQAALSVQPAPLHRP